MVEFEDFMLRFIYTSLDEKLVLPSELSASRAFSCPLSQACVGLSTSVADILSRSKILTLD
jgi:hypothetical protein